MFQDLAIFKTAGALARHAGREQAVIARNIANADTPGYKSQRLQSFAEIHRSEGSKLRTTRPRHLAESSNIDRARLTENTMDADPNGNSVSLESEMLASVDTSRSHDRALAIYQHGLRIIRLSLGQR